MKQSLLTNTLSIVGAITGLIGMFISIFVLHKEKIQLEIMHPLNTKHSCRVGFNKQLIDYASGIPNYSYYPYMLLIWMQITNKSKSPTTILEITLKLPNGIKSTLYSQTSNNYSLASKYSKNTDGCIKIISSWSFAETKLPIPFNPYSTTEGYFQFLNLDTLPNSPFKAILLIKTSQRIIKKRIKLTPTYPEYIEE